MSREHDEYLRKIARDAVPSGVYSGNVKALRAVYETGQAEARAEGWEAAVAAMKYEDGTPLEVIVNDNPYRKERPDATARTSSRTTNEGDSP